MPFTVAVEVAAPPEQAYAYLADPRNRPAWQSSLRRIENLVGTGDAGSTWVDVTSAGVRPRMEVTLSEPPRQWVERGTWRSIRAWLALGFEPLDGGRTRVTAEVELETPGLLAPVGIVLRRLAPPAVRADLERAARLIGGSAPSS